MKRGPMMRPISSAVAIAAPARKLITDEIEQPRKTQAVGEPIEH
jgi:hypothetical protein